MSREDARRTKARGTVGRSVRSLWALCLCGSVFLFAAAGQTGDAAWRQADTPYAFAFPRDHASHPEYKIEWWYYTGNLAARDGRRFGYQLTFFRVGIDPRPENPSRWAVRDLFMTHLAVSDLDGGRYRAAERMNRAGVGWAGAATDAYRVWNEDWEATLAPGGAHALRAAEGGLGVELLLDEGKAPVAHGAGGISQKGAERGNASRYYSLTRMPTRGTLTVDGERFEVEGLSWMDHEFGTSFLEPGQRGWDWFSIQLDDGTELMLFQLRREDGTRDPNSSGTLVEASGAAARVRFGAFELAPGRAWASPDTGARYPVEWTLSAPGLGLELAVSAALDGQEMRTERSTGVSYWEGAVVAEGARGGRPVRGRGYLEMTGYAGRSMGAVMQ